jgi:hypothetical protein
MIVALKSTADFELTDYVKRGSVFLFGSPPVKIFLDIGRPAPQPLEDVDIQCTLSLLCYFCVVN